ncbi:MAG: 2-oxoacid:ferredoxin oxidoreductase subunit beta [bacterium]|nr:2-oxoacid:ferredoxin oxidoreductase subunit beta [bacterium]
MSTALAEKYLRVERLPHIWCRGCGHGIVLGALVRAMDEVGLDLDRTVVVSGIGCASRAAGYLNCDGLHTTHGRALAFATGVKLARPELRVIVIAGDGDLAAIGGNHFIHAARRNLDLTCICFNNQVYGMTSGQHSPTSPRLSLAPTAPYGHLEREFDLCELARAVGAGYVARAAAYNPRAMTRLLVRALDLRGFSFVEVLSQCPTYFGRRNRLGGAVDMLKWQKEHTVDVARAREMDPAELEGKVVTGELHRAEYPEYTAAYAELVSRVKGETGR